MKYVVKDGETYATAHFGGASSLRKDAEVYEDRDAAELRARAWSGRVVRLVPRKPKPVEPERTLGQVAREAMWPFAPPMLPHELRAPDWERVAAAVIAEHERRKAGAK